MESNPLRAKLVRSSGDWRWSSLAIRQGESKEGLALSDGPMELPENWRAWVDIVPNETDLAKIENCIRRSSPLGSDAWVTRTAGRLELESTLRPRGRPRIEKKKGS